MYIGRLYTGHACISLDKECVQLFIDKCTIIQRLAQLVRDAPCIVNSNECRALGLVTLFEFKYSIQIALSKNLETNF